VHPGRLALVLDHLPARVRGDEISVVNPNHQCRGVGSAHLDGVPVDAAAIPILDDRRTHEVRIVLGPGLSS
jgi:hypothetical protein